MRYHLLNRGPARYNNEGRYANDEDRYENADTVLIPIYMYQILVSFLEGAEDYKEFPSNAAIFRYILQRYVDGDPVTPLFDEQFPPVELGKKKMSVVVTVSQELYDQLAKLNRAETVERIAQKIIIKAVFPGDDVDIYMSEKKGKKGRQLVKAPMKTFQIKLKEPVFEIFRTHYGHQVRPIATVLQELTIDFLFNWVTTQGQYRPDSYYGTPGGPTRPGGLVVPASALGTDYKPVTMSLREDDAMEIAKIQPGVDLDLIVEWMLLQYIFPGNVTSYMRKRRTKFADTGKDFHVIEFFITPSMQKVVEDELAHPGEDLDTAAKRLVLDALYGQELPIPFDVMRKINVVFALEETEIIALLERFPSFLLINELAQKIFLHKLMLRGVKIESFADFENLTQERKTNPTVGVFFTLSYDFVAWLYETFNELEEMTIHMFARQVVLSELYHPQIDPDDIQPDEEKRIRVRFILSELQGKLLLERLAHLGNKVNTIARNIFEIKARKLF